MCKLGLSNANVILTLPDTYLCNCLGFLPACVCVGVRSGVCACVWGLMCACVELHRGSCSSAGKVINFYLVWRGCNFTNNRAPPYPHTHRSYEDKPTHTHRRHDSHKPTNTDMLQRTIHQPAPVFKCNNTLPSLLVGGFVSTWLWFHSAHLPLKIRLLCDSNYISKQNWKIYIYIYMAPSNWMELQCHSRAELSLCEIL